MRSQPSVGPALARRAAALFFAFALVHLGAAAMGLAPRAQAQGEDGAAGDKRAEAERLFRTGERAYHAGRYDMAVRAFEASYELLPAPQIAFSTAQALRLQYFVDKDVVQLKRAIELYRVYLDGLPQGDRREVAVTHLAELEPIWLRLEAAGAVDTVPDRVRERPRTGLLALSSQVDAAVATVAGKSGELPFEVEVEPGRYEVTVTADGYISANRTITAVAGAVIPVEVVLEPVPAQVSVATEDGAEILIDGRRAGVTPLAEPVRLLPGEYYVSVSKRGHHGWGQELTVERGQAVSLEADLSRTRMRIASYAVFGFAGLSFLSAGATALQAASQTREARELESRHEREGLTRPEIERYNRLRSDRDNYVGVTYGLIGAGAIAGITGFLLYWFDTPQAEAGAYRARPTSPQVRPLFSPEGAVMSLSGEF
ncbi:MAG: hypothetical protein Tsb0020_22690 [Haliangiales bacterium]